MRVSRGLAGVSASIGFAALLANPAAADITYGFTHVTTNGGAPFASSFSGQFSVNLSSFSATQVDFKFENNVGLPSSITDVYFDDGALLGIASVFGSAGVSFNQNATPPNLPGGNNLSPAFQTTAGFSADSNPPVSSNGVNASGEWVTIRFNLQSGKNFSDVVSDLASGALRVGIHVQSQTGGQSNSYVLIPLPTTAYLGGAGLAGVMAFGWIRRRRLAAS